MPPMASSLAPAGGSSASPSRRRATLIGAYIALALAPVLLTLIDLEPGRGFIINLSVILGFVGLAMLGLQFALVARIRRISRPFGIDVVLQFHRQITFVALAFVLLHPLLLFIDDTSSSSCWTSRRRRCAPGWQCCRWWRCSC